jgi:hypothetical protein
MTFIEMSCGTKRRRSSSRPPLPLKAGDKVLRRSDSGRRVAIGVVESVWGERARIRWPAPTRIGGQFHHSTVKLTSPDLIIATDEAVAEQLVGVRLAIVRQEMGYAVRFCRIDQPSDSEWFARNRTTPVAYFEKLCGRLRERARLLWQAGRELKRLREGREGGEGV